MTRPVVWLSCALAGWLATVALADAAAPALPGVTIHDARQPVAVIAEITIDGQPAAAFWDSYFAGLFALLDRNGDGLLDSTEAARIPRPACLLAGFHGDFDNVTATFVPLSEVDRSPTDDRVSREELAQSLRQAGIGSVELRVAAPAEEFDLGVARGLFDLLASPRGLWDSTTLADAYDRLRRLDVNDDERLSLAELKPLANEKKQPSGSGRAAVSGASAHAGESITAVSGSNRPLVFAALTQADINASPVVKLTLRWDAANRMLQRVDMPDGGGLGGESFKRSNSAELTDSLTCKSGDARLKFQIVRGHGEQDFDSARQSLLQQFEADDLDRDQSLDRREVQQSTSSGCFGMLLATADSNADERLSIPEMNRYWDLQAAAAKHCVVLTASDRGSPLMMALDANGYGSLSLRELKHGWPRLAEWDRSGDHAISWDEVPHEYQLTWSVGRPQPQATISAPSGEQAAPSWFLRMDQNGDGDLSRREFLGTIAAFRQWDADGDGLISPIEASEARKN